VKVKAPWLKVIWVSLKVRSIALIRNIIFSWKHVYLRQLIIYLWLTVCSGTSEGSAWGSLLTVVIVHFKLPTKHEKGYISTSNIELGFELIEFHRFWWICVSAVVYQEKEARYQGCRAKKHILPQNQFEKNLEDMRRRPPEGGPTWNKPRSADPTLGRLTWGSTYQPCPSTSVPPPS
jgi:hypothetical protein